MMPFDAADEVAKKLGSSLDDLFERGTFGQGIEFLASFLALGFKQDHEIADRQLQLFRGKEEVERKLAALTSKDDLARARLKKQLKELDSHLHRPLDTHTPEHAQAYYSGRMDLLLQLIADLGLLSEMMSHPGQFLGDDGLFQEH